MEGPEAGPALRLWRALARRCVGPYGDHAAAVLTLAGWVSWSTGDDPNARVAFSLALRADPDYRFAQLLHRACNGGLDPEELRVCLREERAARLAGDPVGAEESAAPPARREARPEPRRKSTPTSRKSANSPQRHVSSGGPEPARPKQAKVRDRVRRRGGEPVNREG